MFQRNRLAFFAIIWVGPVLATAFLIALGGPIPNSDVFDHVAVLFVCSLIASLLSVFLIALPGCILLQRRFSLNSKSILGLGLIGGLVIGLLLNPVAKLGNHRIACKAVYREMDQLPPCPEVLPGERLVSLSWLVGLTSGLLSGMIFNKYRSRET